MAEDILAGIGCVLLGVFSLVAWWFAMFSGSDWGEAAREMLDGAFNLGLECVVFLGLGEFFFP